VAHGARAALFLTVAKKFLTNLTFGDILATPLLYTGNSSFGAGIINHTRRGPAQEKGTAGKVGGIPLAVSCFNKDAPKNGVFGGLRPPNTPFSGLFQFNCVTPK